MLRLLALVIVPAILIGGTATDLIQGIRNISLDPEECFRVRDLNLTKDEAQFFLTDGYLIFSKPSAGPSGETRSAAVFTADVEGGDAELLLMPPNRSERRSLASYTNAPNLNEHFTAAVMLFADDTYKRLMEQIRASPSNRKSGEMGALLASNWTPVVRNLSSSFETRLMLDLLSREKQQKGYFGAAIRGKQLGNFDVVFDPRAVEQLLVGQIASRQDRTYFDVWTSFVSRSFRNTEVRPEFALSDFRIDSTLLPDLLLRSVTKVKLKLTGGSESVLPFEISPRMQVTAVTVDGEPAELLQHETLRSNLIQNTGNNLFLAIASRPLDPAREHEIEIRHEGRVILDAGNHVYYVGSRGSWYPNRGLQFSRYDLTFHHPKELDLIAAGRLVDERTDGATRTTHRVTSAPIRLAGFNLGVYERARVNRGEFSVEICANRQAEAALQHKPKDTTVINPPLMWPRPRRGAEILGLPDTAPVAPPNPAGRLQALASDIGGVLEYLSAWLGPPPLKSIEVSPIPGRFGQGFAGMIYLSTLSYLSPSDKAVAGGKQQLFFHDLLYAHESAHQWWGNVVTSAGYHDDWIMEALANYSALLYLEKRKGAKIVDSILDDYKQKLLAKVDGDHTVESAGPVVQGARLESSLAPEGWSSIIYGKGTWIMHMLRRRMGDDRFLKMVAALRRKYEYKTLSSEEFRAHCAEFLPPKSGDPKLESFFDEWVYGTGIPSLKLNYAVKGLRLTGTVAQSGVAEDFTTEAPIEVQFGRGRSITYWVRTASDPVAFSFPLKSAPAKVVLDPGGGVLRK